MATGVAVGAGAYVLPASAVVRRMVDARDETQVPSLRVKGTLLFSGKAAQTAASELGVNPESNGISVDAWVLLKAPEKCRLELRSPKTSWAVVESEGRVRVEGHVPPAMQVGLQEVCAFLAERGSSAEGKRAVFHHLQALEVNLRQSSLARVDRQKVAYLLGDGQEGRNQFYVLKDSFQPARIRFHRRDATVWDVRFMDYDSAATSTWFPRVVEVYQGNELAMRFTSLQADTKVALSEKSF